MWFLRTLLKKLQQLLFNCWDLWRSHTWQVQGKVLLSLGAFLLSHKQWEPRTPKPASSSSPGTVGLLRAYRSLLSMHIPDNKIWRKKLNPWVWKFWTKMNFLTEKMVLHQFSHAQNQLILDKSRAFLISSWQHAGILCRLHAGQLSCPADTQCSVVWYYKS